MFPTSRTEKVPPVPLVPSKGGKTRKIHSASLFPNRWFGLRGWAGKLLETPPQPGLPVANWWVKYGNPTTLNQLKSCKLNRMAEIPPLPPAFSGAVRSGRSAKRSLAASSVISRSVAGREKSTVATRRSRFGLSELLEEFGRKVAERWRSGVGERRGQGWRGRKQRVTYEI